MMELDHIFCFVHPEGDWARRAEEAGYVLDDGIEHEGQGTRNRRLWFAEHYLEFVWISSPAQAAANPLRLDQRRCPFGIGLRGQLTGEQRTPFWPYRPPYALDATIWIHEATPDQPFVFAHDAPPETIERHAPKHRMPAALINPGTIKRIQLRLPVAPQPILGTISPRIDIEVGDPRLIVVLGDRAPIALTKELLILP